MLIRLTSKWYKLLTKALSWRTEIAKLLKWNVVHMCHGDNILLYTKKTCDPSTKQRTVLSRILAANITFIHHFRIWILCKAAILTFWRHKLTFWWHRDRSVPLTCNGIELVVHIHSKFRSLRELKERERRITI